MSEPNGKRSVYETLVDSTTSKGLSRLAMFLSCYMISDVYTDWKKFRDNASYRLEQIELRLNELRYQDQLFDIRITASDKMINDRITQISKQANDNRTAIDKLRESHKAIP